MFQELLHTNNDNKEQKLLILQADQKVKNTKEEQ